MVVFTVRSKLDFYNLNVHKMLKVLYIPIKYKNINYTPNSAKVLLVFSYTST